MNKNIKLAVAGAVLALSATAANAGVIIPAGEWTVDISGNVNSFAIWSKGSGTAATGGLAAGRGASSMAQSTGLLPNFLSVSGSTRQNDLDVTWLISINPGGYTSRSLSGGSTSEHRQAFFTFGDKSWGSVKIGKDLGIYASDAILNDMTLLGVGGPGVNAAIGATTTVGRIGSGFQYADWKQQIAYTTPNFNGFQATVGITQAWGPWSLGATTEADALSFTSGKTGGASPAYEGKASYSFAANDVNGKIWVSGFTQKVDGVAQGDNQAWSADIGANIKVAGFDLTGYYYGGEGTGTTTLMLDGYSKATAANDSGLKKRDVDGGYVQAKYTLPFKTVAGLSWGQSNLDKVDGESVDALVKTNEMWTAGLYHPLTKHVNLVAEYSHILSERQDGQEATTNVGSLGGILFF